MEAEAAPPSSMMSLLAAGATRHVSRPHVRLPEVGGGAGHLLFTTNTLHVSLLMLVWRFHPHPPPRAQWFPTFYWSEAPFLLPKMDAESPTPRRQILSMTLWAGINMGRFPAHFSKSTYKLLPHGLWLGGRWEAAAAATF